MVHYSGHGQQISDNNGDEIDKLDETIVCWDTPAFYKKGYTGDKHLRDDELGVMIAVLREKLGTEGQLLVFMDSCHSGTGTRGDKPAVKIRGGTDPLLIPEFESITPGSNEEAEKGFGMSETPVQTRGSGNRMAPMVLFAGASFNELNYETMDDDGNGVGSLSWSIAKVFAEMEDDMTFRSLFNKIHACMSTVAPRQTPMLEGDIDYEIFNGAIVEQEGYFTIERVLNETEIMINGGSIMNLSEGDILGLYPSGTAGTTGVEPILKGTIKSAEGYVSTVKFDKSHGIVNPLDYWIFLKEHNFENRKVDIKIETFNNRILGKSICEQLTGLGLINHTGDNPDLVIRESGKTILIKTAAEDLILQEIISTAPGAVDQCVDAVKRYAQARFIRQLKLDNDDYRVEIRLIPVKAEYEGGKIKIEETLDFAEYLKDDPVPTFTEKDQFLIEVINTGNRSAYFNIIDIQPDGYINPVVPSPGKDGKEYQIKKGQIYIVPDVLLDGFYEPYGTEIFKVFASKDPINLSPIINAKGNGTRSSANLLEAILQESYQKTRGPNVKVSSIPVESSGSTFEFIFRIAR